MTPFNKDQVFDYISTADSWININDALGPVRIRNLVSSLIESINDEGGVSYVLTVDERYRSSTLATVLDALVDVNLLPLEAIYQMQDHLYDLRDNFSPRTANDDKIDKQPEDNPAWGIDETPSVWTTSMALIALLNTGFVNRDTITKEIISNLRDTVYWLVNQAYSDGGWGYQKYPQSEACLSSVPMTALAMKAIIIAQNDQRLFNEDARRNRKFNKIVTALEEGKKFLITNQQATNDTSDTSIYWSYLENPGVVITTWVLETLKLLAESPIPCYTVNDFELLKPKVIRYIYQNLPNSSNIEQYCQSEMFFLAKESTDLKYKPKLKERKAFYTFKPFIISKLLDFGENPFNSQICLVVKWLLENREQHWQIQEYNSSLPCSISAAMAINVIVKWLKSISEQSLSNIVSLFISSSPPPTNNDANCIYNLPCSISNLSDSSSDASQSNSNKLEVFVSRHKIILWFLSVVIMYFLLDFIINLPILTTLRQNLFSGDKYVEVIILGAIGSLLASFIQWVYHKVKRGNNNSNQERGGANV